LGSDPVFGLHERPINCGDDLFQLGRHRKLPFGAADQVADAIGMPQHKRLGELAKGGRRAAVGQVRGKVAARHGAAVQGKGVSKEKVSSTDFGY